MGNREDLVDSSRFMLDQIRLYPALAHLVLFLKLFLLQRGLYDASQGGLGGYLLFCAVLSFLQRHPSAKDAKLRRMTSMGEFLLGFFKYYGREHGFSTTGLSLRKGGSTFDRK